MIPASSRSCFPNSLILKASCRQDRLRQLPLAPVVWWHCCCLHPEPVSPVLQAAASLPVA
jgi:hypothetical protein